MTALWKIIPKQFRLRTVGIVAAIFTRAILNFVGIAVLIPILIIILDQQSLTSNEHLDKVYKYLEFSNYNDFVWAICATIIATILIKNLLILLLYRYEQHYTFSLYSHLSKQMFSEYHNRGLGYIKQNNSALLSRNVNVVCLTFVTGVIRPIATIICETALFALLFVAILLYSPKVAFLAAVIFIPTLILFYTIIRRRLNNIGVEENDAQRAKSKIVAEAFRGYTDLEVNNAFTLQFSKFNDAIKKVVKLRKQNGILAMMPQIVIEVGLAIGLVTLVIICLESQSSEAKILFGLFAIASIRLIPSIRNILSSWSSLQYNRYTIDIIGDIKNHNLSNDIEHNTERFDFRDYISIDNLTFRFEDSPTPTINNLSLRINKGEHIGISGASGIGKTTLFNLILGLYRPTSGSITIDGTLLDDRSMRKWQNTVGYVSQNVFITDGTLAENIALGIDKDNIDYDLINKVVKLADINEFIATLPNGVDTHIGEQGCRLSGGQRQRIGIARALYKRAEILLFDEATSSLDNRTEENINSAIRRLSTENESLTIVVIAHRESSLEYCDRIITIE